MRLLATGILAAIAASSVAAQVSGEDVLKGMGVSPEEVKQLESGSVLAYSDHEYESTDRELAADALVMVNGNLDAISEALKGATTVIPTKFIVDYGEIHSEADFANISYTDDDYKQVERLFNAKPGKVFNFSDAEHTKLQARLAPYRNGSRTEKIAKASEAIREILLGRYQKYRQAGLKGIEPYHRGKKVIDVGHELFLTTETFKPFADDFPEFFNLMENYPSGADCCENYFRWLKLDIRKRATFALFHTMIQQTDNFILYTERQYFVDNTLNTVQVTMSWLPYGENTAMGLAMSASVDILDSMMGKMLRPLGRNKAKDMVTDVLVDVRNELAGKR